jgi:ribosome-binding factor A
MAGRVEKFERQMQRDLGEIFQKFSKDWFKSAFITVSRVQSSPDLGYIKCFVSILTSPKDNISNAAVLQMIDEKQIELRKELASRNRHLRKIPEINYIEDTSLEYVNRMEAIFASLKKDNKE